MLRLFRERGCHVLYPMEEHTEPLTEEDIESYDGVDMAIDPQDGLLTLVNHSNGRRAFALSFDCAFRTFQGGKLQLGEYIDDDGNTGRCCTILMVVGPEVLVDAGFVSPEGILIASDIQDVGDLEKDYGVSEPPVIGFPLPTKRKYLCSQGFGDALTHFFPQTQHAIDLECPIGTPVLSSVTGTVLNVSVDNTVSGPLVSNLFKWNSITVQMHSEPYLVVEFVHIKAGSALVEPGDTVVKGQQLCESGAVGFCPTPHLHIQTHLSRAANAPTVPFLMQSGDGDPFEPVAGTMYP